MVQGASMISEGTEMGCFSMQLYSFTMMRLAGSDMNSRDRITHPPTSTLIVTVMKCSLHIRAMVSVIDPWIIKS